MEHRPLTVAEIVRNHPGQKKAQVPDLVPDMDLGSREFSRLRYVLRVEYQDLLGGDNGEEIKGTILDLLSTKYPVAVQVIKAYCQLRAQSNKISLPYNECPDWQTLAGARLFRSIIMPFHHKKVRARKAVAAKTAKMPKGYAVYREAAVQQGWLPNDQFTCSTWLCCTLAEVDDFKRCLEEEGFILTQGEDHSYKVAKPVERQVELGKLNQLNAWMADAKANLATANAAVQDALARIEQLNASIAALI